MVKMVFGEKKKEKEKKESTAQGLQRDYQANQELLNEERDINKWLVIS